MQKTVSSYNPFDTHEAQLASPHAAAYLRQSTDMILSTWTDIVRRQATCAQASKDTSFLRNSLPDLLQNLAAALENPHWHYGTTRNNRIAREHGRQRQEAHIYTIDKMVDEYAVLRHVICESMQREQRWPSEIIARIHGFVDAAICMATLEFSNRDAQGRTQRLARQRDASDIRADAAQAALHTIQKQRDDASEERDASRNDVAGLLEEKQVRERFVTLLTHDLRSPLSSIGINVQRLEKTPGDAALASRLVPRVLRAVHRIDYMIQDMLDASRLRAGQGMPIAVAACDLTQVVTEAQEDLAMNYGSRIRIQTTPQACGNWDAHALRRVIDNLVGNALKYGSKDTDITIAVTDQTKNVRLTVHNYGHPLSEQEIAGLFDPYVRSKTAETGEQRGWGLGLTLVRGVVEAHGGTVGASSSADSGTTFWFQLPKATC